ncbi:MAG: hypothetical protein EBY95_04225, partial [Actinobacteria bacterium]|nr:hypothetical protein [Actinomycetota bacterium]
AALLGNTGHSHAKHATSDDFFSRRMKNFRPHLLRWERHRSLRLHVANDSDVWQGAVSGAAGSRCDSFRRLPQLFGTLW